ncbi:MAG TPA: mechanosensitive ion channel domain-containing protein, partial [Candidatus Cryosericum sp.]|nr:mechanosensitive ion channel domain-containing protein [Candidatus Cryosericum sp.]
MSDLGPATLLEAWHSPWVQGALTFLVWMAVGLLLRRYLFNIMRRVAERTVWTWDDVLLSALKTPSLIALLSSGLLVGGRVLPLDPEWDRALDVMLAAAMALCIILFVDRGTSGLLDRMASRHRALQGAQGLVQGLARGLIIGIGALIFLDSIGISIAPILASLGVGSLAVALALQETLANVFAGLHLVADKPIEPGHFVRLQSGEEGTVTRVGWRSTWIETPQSNIVVVPNARLAGSVLTNFDLPTSRVTLMVEVTVPLAGDLERIESVTREVAREVQAKTQGATRSHQPAVRFLGFADSGVRLLTTLSAETRADSQEVLHQY